MYGREVRFLVKNRSVTGWVHPPIHVLDHEELKV